MIERSQAWMLDPIEFHRDFEALLSSVDGLVAVRDEALRLWHDDDPAVRSYIETLVLDPDGWRHECEDAHLVEWYRVLMAPYLLPTRAPADPDAVRRGLPELGWHSSEARRLARGRELLHLAERHLGGDTVDRLRLRFGWGAKGWLDHDDLTSALERMRDLDREAFRDHTDLVPVVEDLFEVLEVAATKPDHVVLLCAERRRARATDVPVVDEGLRRLILLG
jgi:hypothetical protein